MERALAAYIDWSSRQIAKSSLVPLITGKRDELYIFIESELFAFYIIAVACVICLDAGVESLRRATLTERVSGNRSDVNSFAWPERKIQDTREIQEYNSIKGWSHKTRLLECQIIAICLWRWRLIGWCDCVIHLVLPLLNEIDEKPSATWIKRVWLVNSCHITSYKFYREIKATFSMILSKNWEKNFFRIRV